MSCLVVLIKLCHRNIVMIEKRKKKQLYYEKGWRKWEEYKHNVWRLSDKFLLTVIQLFCAIYKMFVHRRSSCFAQVMLFLIGIFFVFFSHLICISTGALRRWPVVMWLFFLFVYNPSMPVIFPSLFASTCYLLFSKN